MKKELYCIDGDRYTTTRPKNTKVIRVENKNGSIIYHLKSRHTVTNSICFIIIMSAVYLFTFGSKVQNHIIFDVDRFEATDKYIISNLINDSSNKYSITVNFYDEYGELFGSTGLIEPGNSVAYVSLGREMNDGEYLSEVEYIIHMDKKEVIKKFDCILNVKE